MHKIAPPIDVLATACDALTAGAPDEAARLIAEGYPFAPGTYMKPRRPPRPVASDPESRARRGPYKKPAALRIFLRDGFIDRYFGTRLLFPPVVRVLSEALPDIVPFESYHWPEDRTHPAYFQATPALDHIRPLCRGGLDTEDNLVSTSYQHNEAKGDCSVEEMGWILHREGNLADWDGCLAWFLGYVEQYPDLLTIADVKGWYAAARALNAARG